LNVVIQKSINLVDETMGEEVETSLRYEWLPNFCLFCGLIGHREMQCFIPDVVKKIRYSTKLSVPPVIQGDARTWFMPSGSRQNFPQLGPHLHLNEEQQHKELPRVTQEAVEEVANGVAKLVMNNQGSSIEGVTTTHDAPTVDKVRVVAEPPNYYGPHVLVIVLKTPNHCTCVPQNLRSLSGVLVKLESSMIFRAGSHFRGITVLQQFI
jgi:hypothetical protein